MLIDLNSEYYDIMTLVCHYLIYLLVNPDRNTKMYVKKPMHVSSLAGQHDIEFVNAK